ncbi:ABC transporter permease subunit [Rhizobium sp. NXC24]|uniref:ABC transporter permease n=1 Tax=Rhizobium sp. NXC24 TaxID=2048897 RepID=UPI000CDF5532|nr:ABC transporter permease subunit [Rhizobium sp. NXC24]AVA21325.1 proline/glycine betaine ABC transporter permease protein [Rhizobium sp. NXC24]
MESVNWTSNIDDAIDAGLEWLSTHGEGFFDTLSLILESLFGALSWSLLTPPFYVIILIIGVLGWFAVSLRFAVLAMAGLLLCFYMGLWKETMQTLGLVVSASIIALAIAIPVGVIAGFKPKFLNFLSPILDMVQTLPPYIYLLPAIALLGFGPQTALAATVIVAIPPALRLTALGISLTPTSYLELGQASGCTPTESFFKLRLPYAMPSIMAGVNQCLMLAFGMVVIAGIVGSGGLGTAIYNSVRTLDIAHSIDAAIAIVILTMIIDRITQAAVKEKAGAI